MNPPPVPLAPGPQVIWAMHANTNQPVGIVCSMVFAVYFSEGHKCTHVLSNGGAIIPVKETDKKIISLLKGEPNGV